MKHAWEFLVQAMQRAMQGRLVSTRASTEIERHVESYGCNAMSIAGLLIKGCSYKYIYYACT